MALDAFAFEGDEGGAFDGREDEDAGCFAGFVVGLFRDELDLHAALEGPGVFIATVNVEDRGGAEGDAFGVGAGESEGVAAGFGGGERDVESAGGGVGGLDGEGLFAEVLAA